MKIDNRLIWTVHSRDLRAYTTFDTKYEVHNKQLQIFFFNTGRNSFSPGALAKNCNICSFVQLLAGFLWYFTSYLSKRTEIITCLRFLFDDYCSRSNKCSISSWAQSSLFSNFRNTCIGSRPILLKILTQKARNI